MKHGNIIITRGKLMVLPRHRKNEPDDRASIVAGILLEDIAPESLHGDAIVCEIEIRIIDQYRSRHALGDVGAMVDVMNTNLAESDHWDCVNTPQNVIADNIVFDKRFDGDDRNIIYDAMKAARDVDPEAHDLVWISERLKKVLGTEDVNWERWVKFVEKHGVKP